MFHLQYISNVMAMSRVMSLQHRYNIRMSTVLFNLLSSAKTSLPPGLQQIHRGLRFNFFRYALTTLSKQ